MLGLIAVGAQARRKIALIGGDLRCNKLCRSACILSGRWWSSACQLGTRDVVVNWCHGRLRCGAKWPTIRKYASCLEGRENVGDEVSTACCAGLIEIESHRSGKHAKIRASMSQKSQVVDLTKWRSGNPRWTVESPQNLWIAARALRHTRSSSAKEASFSARTAVVRDWMTAWSGRMP